MGRGVAGRDWASVGGRGAAFPSTRSSPPAEKESLAGELIVCERAFREAAERAGRGVGRGGFLGDYYIGNREYGTRDDEV